MYKDYSLNAMICLNPTKFIFIQFPLDCCPVSQSSLLSENFFIINFSAIFSKVEFLHQIDVENCYTHWTLFLHYYFELGYILIDSLSKFHILKKILICHLEVSFKNFLL